MTSTKWESYEKVAQFLLAQLRSHLGLQDVEGKQKIKGLRSGTEWEVDAKGINSGPGEMFVIIECRRHIKSGQKQEHLAALAYRILDTGASGGIIVSPLPLQEGAQKVAQAENILEVTLGEDSTTTDYIMSFLNQIMIGASDRIIVHDSVSVILTDADGNIGSDDT